MIKIAIAGGTGYTAGELLRILVNHPQAEITAVLSVSEAESLVSSVHRDLLGDTEIRFTSVLPNGEEPDVLFLCLGHGLSRGYLDRLGLGKCKVIDLGNDFRLDGAYAGGEFVYGLTELNRERIAGARYVANPGCFATSILLPLVPLASAGKLIGEVHVTAITGSTGAGKTPSEATHFSYRDSNVSVYKPFGHQHLGEIDKTLRQCTGGDIPQVNFVPMRGDFTRGIFASVYTAVDGNTSLGELRAHYRDFYSASPFVHISDLPVSMKEVVNTNKALIHISLHDGYWHFTSVIDNLLKGASGQAVQNMNLLFGLPETTGLKLKGSAF